MNNRHRWAVIAAALVLAAIVGVVAYNAGVARGIADSGKLVAAPAGAPYPYPYYGWHRPWGPGHIFAPFLLILFVFLIVRGLFWRGRGACSYRGDLDEWHRRAHERMWNQPSGGEPAER